MRWTLERIASQAEKAPREIGHGGVPWGRSLAAILLALVAWTGLQPSTGAAPPRSNRAPQRGGETSQVRDAASLAVREENGPWMILAAVFSGDTAEQDAVELAVELRNEHRLPAYLHSEHFDFTQSVEGLGVDKYNRPRRMRYAQAEAFDEVAVLVGDFESYEEPRAEQTLKMIKKLRPKCLAAEDESDTSLRFASLRRYQQMLSRSAKEPKGPLAKAFVTRNPLLPQEYFVPKGVDKLTLEMNEGVKYSLLECPGKFSVRVATFGGKVVIDQKKVLAIASGEARMESRLEEAAVKAHKLTMALRKRGIEAYEFHDRHESIVTVGNFDSIGEKLPNGQIELDAEVFKVIDKFSARRREFPGRNGATMAGLEPRSLEGITFDVQPLPVQVPRRSIAADYARGRS